jgi:2-oxoglutarate ferredoxin oxidoreductase subunit gamma
MTTKVIMAGFGGQGVVLIGTLLAYAGMKEGKHATFFPSYGAEMRGGTANCSVIVSDSEIASPVVTRPDSVVTMNVASLEKFEPTVRAGGSIFVNSSLVDRLVARKDVTEVRIPANALAEALGSSKAANMVMLGGLIKKTGAISLESAIESLSGVLSERAMALLDVNKRALTRGYEEVS